MNAAAITYRPNGETKQSSERLPKKRGIIDCEIIAMILAIEHNIEEPKILILSDNQTALEYCEYAKKKGTLAHHNERLFKALRKFEGKIQSSYIPAHTGIEGNEKADEAAKNPTQEEPEDELATIPYIKEELKKRRKEAWLKWFNEKTHEYDQRPNTKTYHRLKNQRWKDTSIILRLKSNKGWGNNIAKNDRKCKCGQEIDTEHLWTCREYKAERPKTRKYDEQTIKWAKRHKYFGTPIYKNNLESINAYGGNPLRIRNGGNCKHCGKKFPNPQSKYGHVCPIKPNPNNRCGGCGNYFANMRLHKPRCRGGDLTCHGCGKTYGSLKGLVAHERQGKCTGSRS
jgi:hypothetical protein